jgi:excisionase family DNA binding protein
MDMRELDEATVVGVNLDEPLLTAQHAAELLAVPRTSVYEYARRLHDPLPAMRVGRQRRVYRSDVAAWLSQQR